MRLRDIITIYLALGAPLAVHYFLQNREKNFKAVLKALGVMLMFPFVVVRLFLSRNPTPQHQFQNEKVERNKCFVFSALNEIRDSSKRIKENESIERLVFVIRENLEKYSGLAVVSEQIDENDEPSKHEKEVFHVSGCETNEIKIAASCMHRRNVKQIILHRNRARNNLLHALAEIEETVNESKALLMNPSLARQINESLTRLYKNTIEVLFQIEDENAAEIIDRLLNKTLSQVEKSKEVLGEERCLHTVRPRHAQPSQQQTTLTQG